MCWPWTRTAYSEICPIKGSTRLKQPQCQELQEDGNCNSRVCKKSLCYFLYVELQRNWKERWLLRFLDHTQLDRDTLGRNPTKEWPAHHIRQYLHNTQKPNAHALSGMRTRAPRNEAAADRYLRPQGQRVRRCHMEFCHWICADTLM